MAGLRELFDGVGPVAFRVATALTEDRAEAEAVVVGAFVAAGRRPGTGATFERRAILASVVAQCEQRRGSKQLAADGDDVWQRVDDEQRTALALVSIGGCSLNEAAVILALEHRTVAELLRDALRSVKGTRDSVGSVSEGDT